MGALSALLLAAAAAAAPAAPAPARDAFRFDGPEASATADGGPAVLRLGGTLREGTGSAFLRGEDRVRAREMTYGDAGELWMRVAVGGDVYRVELDAVGFPPEQALPKGSKRSWWKRPEGPPRRPEHGVEGGVVLGRVVNRGSGLGLRDMPARRAAVALWGIGRLYRNDELVAARARVAAQALPGADEVTKEGTLRARARGNELDVFVDGVPEGVSKAGFLHFVIEGAAISEPAPARAVAAGPGAEVRKETRDERLGRRPTVDEQWDSGRDMVAWRDEERPEQQAAAPARGPGSAPATGPAQGVTVYGPAQATPGAASAPAGPAPSTAQGSALAPGSGASAPAPAPTSGPAYAASSPYGVPPGTQTVMQPPPPLMAVPATPNTAPIQYETGQNGGNIGLAPIGGGGFAGAGAPTTGGYGGSGFTPGTGVFGQTT
ncbi:MAG TPA: hypothetical protein VFB81_22435, partial [Myxococcales bacterium]|nr:hypothetical protein [Myxococcales bacterium]